MTLKTIFIFNFPSKLPLIDDCFRFSACTALTVPANSVLSPSDPSEFYEGKTVAMSCGSGYKAVGVEQVTCTTGTWNDTFGTCEQRMSCFFLTTQHNYICRLCDTLADI